MNIKASEFKKSSTDVLLFDNRISEIFTIGELSERLKISVSGLRKIIARDCGFPRYKVGHQMRFSWIEVERYFHKGE